MRLSDKRGIVLVTGLLILAILSLLGAGSILSSSIDTSTVGNQKTGKQVFYAADAALNAATLEIMNSYRTTGNFIPPDPAVTVNVTSADHGFDGSDFNGYALTYTITWAPKPNPEIAVEFPSMENGMALGNMAREYVIEATAAGINSTDSATVRETLRVLTRPLTNYLAFYEGNMNLRPQAAAQLTVNGGRVHANGSIYLAPQNGLLFEFDAARGSNALTAAGSILRHTAILQSNSESASGGGDLELTTPMITPPVKQPIAQSITPLNRGQFEFLFNVETDSGVRVGVDDLRMDNFGPAARRAALVNTGGSYDLWAQNPGNPLVDTFKIDNGGGVLNISLNVNGGGLLPVESEVKQYHDSAGNVVGPGWPGAEVNPDNITTLGVDLIEGTIVYSSEDQPVEDHAGTIYPPVASNIGDTNRDYPSLLENNDPREGKPVEFTVIDLQRLQYWYRDYLVSMGIDPFDPPRSLLIYASRADTNFSVQAIKLIGSVGGRVRGGGTVQNNPTLLVPTIIATPNPVYIEGDFNNSGTLPCVVVADAVTFISNAWGELHYGAAAGITEATSTAYSAGIIAGRYDYTGGGPASEAEGVEDLPRRIENWTGVAVATLTFNGSLASPWFSAIADAPFNPAMVTAPNYALAYDTTLRNLMDSDLAPFVPSIYTVDRESWREE